MKKFRRFLICWCIPGLLLLPIGGCFTALSHFMGNSPSVPERIIAGTLDVATMPVQIAVFGPMILHDYIERNTGEAGRQKRERERWEKAVTQHQKLLDEDFCKVYEIGDFLSATNTPAREALNRHLMYYKNQQLDHAAADRLGTRMLEQPELLLALGCVLRQQNMTPELRTRLARTLVQTCHSRPPEDLWGVLHHALNVLDDDALRAEMSPNDDAVDKTLARELKGRDEARERERRRVEEDAAQRKADEERSRQEAIERQKAWEKRREKLMALAREIEGTPEAFRKSLGVRGEMIVSNHWRTRLRNTAQPLPVENVRALADAVTQPGEPPRPYARELFLRPELTDADLRRLYSRVLTKLKEKGDWQRDGWRDAGALIKNPNFPADLARATYTEPLLVELRIVYVFHHAMPDVPRGELQAFEQRGDALRRDCEAGKITLEKCCRERGKLAAKYLPSECPADWIQSIP